MKKLTILLAAMLGLAFAAPAFAEDDGDAKPKKAVKKAKKGDKKPAAKKAAKKAKKDED